MSLRSSASWRLVAALAATTPMVLTGLSNPAIAKSRPAPAFALSGLVTDGAPLVARPAQGAQQDSPAALSAATATIGSNVDVIGRPDVVQKAKINGVTVNTCNAGKETAQNETTIAVNPADPKNLVAGANDYRLYEPSENRYDASGGFYRSADGGKTWSAGFLPGLVRGNTAAPGPYESAGDPAVSAGPAGIFWYSNIAFNRSDTASAVSASRSSDGGKTWTTHYVFKTPAGGSVFNDKDWIAADPLNGNVAYVTWTPVGATSPIVISKTIDGGVTWSNPVQVGPYTSSTGSQVLVDSAGTVHVVYETNPGTGSHIGYSRSTNGGATFATKLLSAVADIPSPLPGATFRDNSFPTFAMAGRNLHVAWSQWTGTHAVITYTRSINGGTTWSTPSVLGGLARDQFFPGIAANGTTVQASWFYRSGSGDTYVANGAGSTNSGATWTAPFTLSTVTSDVSAGNFFSFPNCAASFIGDYSSIAVGSDGVGHPLWTDIRLDNLPHDTNSANQDPYTATVTIP